MREDIEYSSPGASTSSSSLSCIRCCAATTTCGRLSFSFRCPLRDGRGEGRQRVVVATAPSLGAQLLAPASPRVSKIGQGILPFCVLSYRFLLYFHTTPLFVFGSSSFTLRYWLRSTGFVARGNASLTATPMTSATGWRMSRWTSSTVWSRGAASSSLWCAARHKSSSKTSVPPSFLSSRLANHQELDAGIASRQHHNRKALKRSKHPFRAYFRSSFPCSPSYRVALEACWRSTGKRRQPSHAQRLSSSDVARERTSAHLVASPFSWESPPSFPFAARSRDAVPPLPPRAAVSSSLLSSEPAAVGDPPTRGGAVVQRFPSAVRSVLGPAPATPVLSPQRRRQDVLETVTPQGFGGDAVLDPLVRALLDVRFTWDREDGLLAMSLLPEGLYAYTEHTRAYGKLSKRFFSSLQLLKEKKSRGESSCDEAVLSTAGPPPHELGRGTEEGVPLQELDQAKDDDEDEDDRIPSRVLYLLNGQRVPIYSGHPKQRLKKTSCGYHGVEAMPSMLLDIVYGPLLSSTSSATLGLRWTVPYRPANQVQTVLQVQQSMQTMAAGVVGLGPRSVWLMLKAVASCELESPGLEVSLAIAATEHFYAYNDVECLELLRCLRRLAVVRALPKGLLVSSTAAPDSSSLLPSGRAAPIVPPDTEIDAVEDEEDAEETTETSDMDEGEVEPLPLVSLLYKTSSSAFVSEAFCDFVHDTSPQLVSKVWHRLPEVMNRLRLRGLYLDWLDWLSLAMELAPESVGGGLPKSADLLQLQAHGIAISTPPPSPALYRQMDRSGEDEEEEDHDGVQRRGERGTRANAWEAASNPAAAAMRRYFYVRYVLEMDSETVQHLLYWLTKKAPRRARDDMKKFQRHAVQSNNVAKRDNQDDETPFEASSDPKPSPPNPSTKPPPRHASGSKLANSASVVEEPTESVLYHPLLIWRSVGLLVRCVAEALGDVLEHLSEVLGLLVQLAVEELTPTASTPVGKEKGRAWKDSGEEVSTSRHAVEFRDCSSRAGRFFALPVARLETDGEHNAYDTLLAHRRRPKQFRLRLLPMKSFPHIAQCLGTPFAEAAFKAANTTAALSPSPLSRVVPHERPATGLPSRFSLPLAAALEQAPEAEWDMRRAASALRWATRILQAAHQATRVLRPLVTVRNEEQREEEARASREPVCPSDTAGAPSSGEVEPGRRRGSEGPVDPTSRRQALCYRLTKATVQSQLDVLFTAIPFWERVEDTREEKRHGPTAAQPETEDPSRKPKTSENAETLNFSEGGGEGGVFAVEAWLEATASAARISRDGRLLATPDAALSSSLSRDGTSLNAFGLSASSASPSGGTTLPDSTSLATETTSSAEPGQAEEEEAEAARVRKLLSLIAQLQEEVEAFQVAVADLMDSQEQFFCGLREEAASVGRERNLGD